MKKVLVNAYAVAPGKGSELGLGWNWCIRLSRTCELFVITEGEYREEIEKEVRLLPQGRNLHFFYLPVSDRVRRMCWNQGDWRFYLHYERWQRRALQKAREICAAHRIDVIHHLNMIGFREPGFLWTIPGYPYVHGPINCKCEYPLAYWADAPFREKCMIRLKGVLSRFQMRHSHRFHATVSHADVVITASTDSQRLLEQYVGKSSYMINETGCGDERHGHGPFSTTGLDILWVGRLALYSKLPGLALQAVAKTGNPRLRIHFVGPGDDTALRSLADTLGIGESCHWYGSVSHQEVQEMMRKMDCLLFTSVSEGTPHVVLEAISNGLPVICLDTCGQGDIVDGKTGVKIPLTNPARSAQDFADILNELERHPETLQTLSDGCAERLPDLSWEAIIRKVTTIYDELLEKH